MSSNPSFPSSAWECRSGSSASRQYPDAKQSFATPRSQAELGNETNRERAPVGERMSNRGRIFVVGLGPGARAAMTAQALEAIRCADVVIGYDGYFSGVADLV